MLDDAIVPAIAALGIALALIVLGKHFGLGPWRRRSAGLATGALAGLIAAEFYIDGAGNWWANHPTTGATVTGLLLLALTVLVVEAAVERAFALAEEPRWRSSGRVAAETALAGVADAMRSFGPKLRKATEELRNTPQGDFDGRSFKESADASERAVRLSVLREAPVLTATDRLHRVFDRGLKAVDDAADLRAALRHWEDQHLPFIAEQGGMHDVAVDNWTNYVVGSWDHFISHMSEFDAEASDELDANLGFSPPWR